MITVVAKSFFKEESLKEVLAVYRKLVDQTRQEAGCRRYELFQELAHPNHLTMIEEWETEEALKAHTANPAFLALVVPLRAHASAPSELTTYSRVL